MELPKFIQTRFERRATSIRNRDCELDEQRMPLDLRVGMVAVSIIICVLSTADSLRSGDPFLSVHKITEIAESVNKSCGNNNLPDKKISKPLTPTTAETYSEINTGYQDMINAAAIQSGVEVIDGREYIERIENSTSPEEALKIANEYSSQHGIDIVYVDSQNKEWEMRNFDHIPIVEVQIHLISIISSLQRMPTGLIELSGLKKLSVTETIEDTDYNNEIIAGRAGLSGKILLSFKGLRDGDVLAHETAHLIDYRMCGLFDIKFEGINPVGDGYYGTYIRGRDSNRENYITHYAQTNEQEDFAETLEALLGDFSLIFEPGPAGEKARLVMRLIEQRVPGISKYFMNIGIGWK